MSKTSSLAAGRPSAGKSRPSLTDLADTPATKRINFKVAVEQHTKLKIYAAKQGKSIKQILTEYVASITQ
jgi:hypothetical protein